MFVIKDRFKDKEINNSNSNSNLTSLQIQNTVYGLKITITCVNYFWTMAGWFVFSSLSKEVLCSILRRECKIFKQGLHVLPVLQCYLFWLQVVTINCP